MYVYTYKAPIFFFVAMDRVHPFFGVFFLQQTAVCRLSKALETASLVHGFGGLKVVSMVR